MTGPELTDTPVVRMFPDYAGTVLWFTGPVNYVKTRLSGELVEELQDWEQLYEDSLTPAIEWVSPEAEQYFADEGRRLALLVAEEIGPGFTTELSSITDDPLPNGARLKPRFRSDSPASNPAASLVFNRLAEEIATEQEELRRLQIADAVSGGRTGWIAYAPLSDTTFTPDAAAPTTEPDE